MALPADENPDAEFEDDAERDTTLQAIFNRAAGIDGDNDIEEAEAAVEEKPAVVDTATTDRLAAVETELQKTKDRALALETRNNLLQMQQDDARNRQPIIEEKDNSEDELATALAAAKDAKALAKAIREHTKKEAEKIKAEAVRDAVGTTTNESRIQDAFRRDQTAVATEFGFALNSNEDFAKRANQIYDNMTANAEYRSPTGNPWRPDAMYSAVSIAFSQLVREGKISVDDLKPRTAGEIARKAVALVPRRKAPLAADLGTDNAVARASSVESDYSPRELSIIDAEVRKMGNGVTRQSYLKRVAELKKRDPGFGTGV